MTREEILEILKTVNDPELRRDIVSLGMVKDVKVEGENVFLEVTLTTPACPLKNRIANDIRQAIRSRMPQVGEVNVNFGSEVRGSRPVGVKTNLLPTVKNVIAVGSGKGGVGKSTVALNLAIALQQEGARVGLLDADIYGPSLPVMCGVKDGERPTVDQSGYRITPLFRFGMPLMSMGFLMGAGDAVIWRGPMLSKALQQFLEQVEWGDLDYLIVDLPPGTGDVQLSLSQMIPLSGAVVVTTPQDVALADVKRAIKMFEITQVPILGVVENMSRFECPHCHQLTAIFGGGDNPLEMSMGRYEKLGSRLLGELPLEPATRVSGDEGEPINIRDPKSPQAERFRAIAREIAAAQSVQNLSKDLDSSS